MARFNEILAGRYNRFLQKLFQLKGGPPSAQLASEVMPVFPFFTGVEHRYLEGWDRYAIFLTQPAVAAQNSALRIRNPATSNIVIVIEGIIFKNNSGAAMALLIDHGPIGVDLGTLVTTANLRLDARSRPQPASIVSRANNATVIPINKFQFIAPNATAVQVINCEDQEITILPGDALDMETGGQVNIALEVSLLWRERALEESELK